MHFPADPHGSAAQARNVEFDTACAPKLGYLDQRLYGLAHQGADELRRFVWTRRGIYELNVMDTADWVDEVNLARASCLKQRALAPDDSHGMQALAPTPPR